MDHPPNRPAPPERATLSLSLPDFAAAFEAAHGEAIGYRVLDERTGAHEFYWRDPGRPRQRCSGVDITQRMEQCMRDEIAERAASADHPQRYARYHEQVWLRPDQIREAIRLVRMRGRMGQ